MTRLDSAGEMTGNVAGGNLAPDGGPLSLALGAHQAPSAMVLPTHSHPRVGALVVARQRAEGDANAVNPVGSATRDEGGLIRCPDGAVVEDVDEVLAKLADEDFKSQWRLLSGGTWLLFVCIDVCMFITYSRVWINRVRLPILLVVS